NQIIILVTLALPTAVLSTSALGFLGLGAQPPAPDWGVILSEGVKFIKIAPWISIAPGIALLYVVLGYNILGEGLKDMLDPRNDY
ncbi:MAG TPA: ABC transporter permease, partial [Anaerovoracaceae bacterium]|nr:ABC transporter permease [Anaerovoracaceae bacterium]